MKKVSVIFTALLLVLISCFSVFAAGINSAEQSVLSNMRTPANMGGNQVYVPAAYVNQAEAHFNTIDMTQEQADKINSIISTGRSFLEGTGKDSIGKLSASERQTILAYASQAADALKLTAVAGSNEERIKITTKDGTVIVDESNNVIKTTGFHSTAPLIFTGASLTAALIAAGAILIFKKRELRNEEI